MRFEPYRALLFALGSLVALGCGAEGVDAGRTDGLGASQARTWDGIDPEAPHYQRFRAFDEAGTNAYGVEGVLPPNEELADVYYDMTEAQRRGLAAWHLFGAYRGHFFRTLQKETWNASNMLRVIDSRGRDDRFERTGLLNDPDCVKRSQPDEFGLYLDDCPRDPYSAGMVGLRLRPNPDFDMDAWLELGDGDVRRSAEIWTRKPRDRFDWKSDAMEEQTEVEPPYEVVMTCTVCHAAPNPIDPPTDPNKASWKQIVFALGNQYFKEGNVFVDAVPKDDFMSAALEAQPPGTSDTSRMANDHIFNPNTINAVFNLGLRPTHTERVHQFDEQGLPVYNGDIKPDTCDGETCEVDTFRVLKDGGDSSGPSGAALRVFINIGSCFDEFEQNMDPVWGIKHPHDTKRLQTPVSRRKLETECPDYQRLLSYTPDIIDYLKFVKPYRLADAPGGASRVKAWDDPQMALGRTVFAQECATCHSSKQPEFPTGQPTVADVAFEREFVTWTTAQQTAWLKDPARVAWFEARVNDPAFFDENFLSDDKRYPLSLLGTNSARAMGSNAGAGNVWAEYASKELQTMPPVKVPVYDYSFGLLREKPAIEGPVGRGYYRTASLWGIWSSAPFLNNNGLGVYNGKTDVAGRLEAYQTGMEQLLGLKARAGHVAKTNRFVALTTAPLAFDLPDLIPGIDIHKLKLGLPVPPGTPIALVANLGPSIVKLTKPSLPEAIRMITDPGFFAQMTEGAITVFDPVMDKGHTFGRGRTDAEKRALIEFLKTL